MFLYKYEIIENILKKQDGFIQKDLIEIHKASDVELQNINKTLGKKIRSIYSLWNVRNPNCFEYKTENRSIFNVDNTVMEPDGNRIFSSSREEHK